jgi:hypothetical protein
VSSLSWWLRDIVGTDDAGRTALLLLVDPWTAAAIPATTAASRRSPPPDLGAEAQGFRGFQGNLREAGGNRD